MIPWLHTIARYRDTEGGAAGEIVFLDIYGIPLLGPVWSNEAVRRFRLEAGQSFLSALCSVGVLSLKPHLLPLCRTHREYGIFLYVLILN